MKEPSLFSQQVIELALSIPKGRVTTYGDIARAAGGGNQAARSITHILSRHPEQSAIPYHRIVYSNGTVWLSPTHKKKRLNQYLAEGIIVDSKGRITNFEDIRLEFK